jgi:ribose transport system ATP-binding protein
MPPEARSTSPHVNHRSQDSTTVPALELIGLSKSFSGKTVLSGVSLHVAPGEVHVLLGQNGSGKSTLIKILSGFHTPDPGGEVLIGGEPLTPGSSTASHRVGCRFVHQDLGLIEQETVLDNLAIGRGYATRFGTIRPSVTLDRAKSMLARVGLEIDPLQNLSHLSDAQRTGVAVARALDSEGGEVPALLVLDEPTATLPADEVQHLLSMLRTTAAAGVGIVYVTHHLDDVFQIADRVSVLRDGHLVRTVPIAEIDRAGLVHLLLGAELENAPSVDQVLTAADPTPQAPRLVVRDLVSSALHGVSFAANAGDVVGIHGLTGSGRESILASVFGAIPRDSGEVLLDGRPIVADNPRKAIRDGLCYLPNDRSVRGAMMDLSARENFTLPSLKQYWGGLRLKRSQEISDGDDWFARLDVRPRDGLDRPFASFSGGNQQKVLLAKWLRLEPRVLLLDEPTQGVDIGAKIEIHKQILAAAEAGAAVVVSTTDEDELVAICSQVLVIRDGRPVAVLRGAQISPGRLNRALHEPAAAHRGGLDSS